MNYSSYKIKILITPILSDLALNCPVKGFRCSTGGCLRFSYSSRRWKTNIHTLNGALDKVRRLRGVTYDWKADGKRDVGLIAGEVGEVIPEIVEFDQNGNDAKSVDYARLVAVLIEAVKEQQKDIEKLREMLKSVISENHVSAGAMR